MKDGVYERTVRQTDTEADGMRVHLVNFFQHFPKSVYNILFWPFELFSEDNTEIKKVLHDWILHPKKNGENVCEKRKMNI